MSRKWLLKMERAMHRASLLGKMIGDENADWVERHAFAIR